MKILRNVFLLPCLPYYIFIGIFIIYKLFLNNSLSELAISNLDEDEELTDWADDLFEKTEPFEYAVSTIVWCYLIFKVYIKL